MSGEALKAPPEAKMSQEEIAANMNPSNIHFKPLVHDEVMNLHEKPVDGQERSLSSVSIVVTFCLDKSVPTTTLPPLVPRST